MSPKSFEENDTFLAKGNIFEFLDVLRTWMTIIHGLTFVLWIIMMNPGFVPGGSVQEKSSRSGRRRQEILGKQIFLCSFMGCANCRGTNLAEIFL